MDLIKQLGELALGSRLRRLSERLIQDVTLFYKEENIDFEPKWFPIFYLLSQSSPLSIVDIAKELGITHPAVNQTAGEMIKKGLVTQLKDKNDKRKRLLTLTHKGKALLPLIQPLWRDVEVTARGLTIATGFDVLAVIDKMEQELDKQGFYARLAERRKQRHQACVEIVDYQPGLKNHFKTLNLEWIGKYFQVEEADERVLSDPEKEVLKDGGYILFAKYQDQVVGTCALLKRNSETYELAKMAVTEQLQGKQIGRILLKASIEKAKSADARFMELETNSKLTRAINLYRQHGFVLVPFEPDKPSEYTRSDMRMKLDLETADI